MLMTRGTVSVTDINMVLPLPCHQHHQHDFKSTNLVVKYQFGGKINRLCKQNAFDYYSSKIHCWHSNYFSWMLQYNRQIYFSFATVLFHFPNSEFSFQSFQKSAKVKLPSIVAGFQCMIILYDSYINIKTRLANCNLLFLVFYRTTFIFFSFNFKILNISLHFRNFVPIFSCLVKVDNVLHTSNWACNHSIVIQII